MKQRTDRARRICMTAFLRKFSIQHRLLAIFSFSVFLLLGLSALLSTTYYDSLLDGRHAKTREVVETSFGILEHYHALGQSGVLSEAEAKAQALAVIKTLRYNESDYFWVNDTSPRMIMHPINPKLDGTALEGFKDANGLPLFNAMVEVTEGPEASGFVDYLWPKPGFDNPVEKTSYVKRFKPWNWILGSGIYLDDVSTTFWTTMAPKMVLTGLGIVLLLAASMTVGLSILRPLGKTLSALQDISNGEGDLRQRLDEGGNDELSSLAVAFNRFTGRMSEMVQELRGVIATNQATAVQVRTAADQARGHAGQQKQELDTVAAAVEEMVVTIEDVARRIGTAAQSAKDADNHAMQGGKVIESTSFAMDRLAQNIGDAAQAISELNQDTQAIGSVLDVIRGVAEQTNLLALNAAIEAARAGEQGRGFAVVADEVRTLASRTQTSTDEINGMITRLQERAAKAVQTMQASQSQSGEMREQVGEARGALSAIVESVSAITDMTQHVATAAEQQSATSGEISQSLSQITRLSDELVTQMDETTANIRTLGESAEGLDRIVNQFQT
ncbi:methyl-accepting chemotaxis protein [Hydrocarboniclastica marina]|uniref:Methyl-accepting chemotaxis protein n=2 Tax=Hydrocarboniclastica marina TaxID=2259620 RepID=A0A4P7XJ50_9ALTE|nr:methyl-accepting chemotaxis protein [Hydrocarboniclastica marina]